MPPQRDLHLDIDIAEHALRRGGYRLEREDDGLAVFVPLDDARLHRVPLTLDLGRGIITEDDFRAQLEDQGMSSSWVETVLAEVRGAG